jgi:hypothetical protein
MLLHGRLKIVASTYVICSRVHYGYQNIMPSVKDQRAWDTCVMIQKKDALHLYSYRYCNFNLF